MESIGSNRWRRRRKDREAEPSILIGWWAGVTWDRAKSCWDSLISAAHCSSTPAPMSLSLSDSVAFLSLHSLQLRTFRWPFLLELPLRDRIILKLEFNCRSNA